MLTEKGRTKNKFVLQMDDLHTNTCIPKYSVEKISSCLNVITIRNIAGLYISLFITNNIISDQNQKRGHFITIIHIFYNLR